MMELVQLVVLILVIVVGVQRNRKVIREIAIVERQASILTRETNSLSNEIERRRQINEMAAKGIEDAKASIESLQTQYVTEREKLVKVRRIPPVTLWPLDRNPPSTVPLWCVRVIDRTDARASRSMVLMGSGAADGNAPDLHAHYIVAATTGEDAQRQLKGRITSLSFDVVETRPIRSAISHYTAPRRTAGKETPAA